MIEARSSAEARGDPGLGAYTATPATAPQLMHPPHSSLRPQGRITRGKTARNRLRRADAFLAAYDPALLIREDGPFAGAWYVDLGYGAEPWTALESAARLRRVNPKLRVMGVEIDPERVERGLPFADARTDFRLGGFNLPLGVDPHGRPETVRLVRAFNVLRQYDEHEVEEAYRAVCSSLLPGGLLMDGTSDPAGRIWTANMVRRTDDADGDSPPWKVEALVLGTNFRGDLEPESFRTRLPKSFIHRMASDEPTAVFMEDWLAACRDTRACGVWGPRTWFGAAARALADRGHDVITRSRWLRMDWLVWRNPEAT